MGTDVSAARPEKEIQPIGSGRVSKLPPHLIVTKLDTHIKHAVTSAWLAAQFLTTNIFLDSHLAENRKFNTAPAKQYKYCVRIEMNAHGKLHITKDYKTR